MKNLSLIRRFTVGSMLLGLAVPMIYHVSLNVARYNHFNSLASQVCKAIEPRIQIGAQREALEYLVSTVTSQGLGASPEVEFKDHGTLITAPIQNPGSKFHETCEFQGIAGVEVGVYYAHVPLLNPAYLYIFLGSVPILFLMFMFARRGVMRLQRKVADLIESQMKQLFGMDVESTVPKTGLFYKLFDLEIPLLKYLKKHVESLEADLKVYSEKVAAQQKREVLMDVAAQMAHEIVTPISNLQTILKSNEANEHKDLLLLELAQIKKFSENLLREYRELPPLQKQADEKFEVIECLQTILEGTKLYAKNIKPVEFVFDFDSSEKCELTGDRSQFVAAISNILRNSVEALDKSVSQITVRLLKDADFLTLQISDNGCGIEEKNLRRVFENKVSIGKKNGTGIGLYQVKSTIENMGGEIVLESKLNIGTAMTLRWPIQVMTSKATDQIQGPDPISIDKTRPDLVLIDDRKVNHTAWEIEAKRRHKKLVAFQSLDGFLSSLDGVNESTPIFVDYLFDNESMSGKEIAESLISRGFNNVHIATGLPADQVVKPLGVRSVLSKDFPVSLL